MKSRGKSFARPVPGNQRFLNTVFCLASLLAFAAAGNACATVDLAETSVKPPVIMVIKKVRYSAKKATAIAEGRVQVAQGGMVVDADRITYNLATGAVHASGHVSVMNASCNPVYMNDTMLGNSLAKGVIQQFHVLLRHNKKFVAREMAGPSVLNPSFRQASISAIPAKDAQGRLP